MDNICKAILKSFGYNGFRRLSINAKNEEKDEPKMDT